MSYFSLSFRPLFFGVMVALTAVLVGCAQGPASDQTRMQIETPKDVDWALIPGDAGLLSDLNGRQELALRRVTRRCEGMVGSVGNARFNHHDPCVVSQLDAYIRTQDDPVLASFHFALPPRDRYDAFRAPEAVGRLLKRRQKMLQN